MNPLQTLRHHVSGAIARGEAAPIVCHPVTETTHLYVTDGHEGAGWNRQGITHRVDTMRSGDTTGYSGHRSRDAALSAAQASADMLASLGMPCKVHDLTTEAKALRRYRDGRAIHISTLKRWKAALRSTDGNPRMVERIDLGEREFKREAVETGVMMAREALAKLRHDRGAA